MNDEVVCPDAQVLGPMCCCTEGTFQVERITPRQILVNVKTFIGMEKYRFWKKNGARVGWYPWAFRIENIEEINAFADSQGGTWRRES